MLRWRQLLTMLIALFLATCFLAYSNGANDNFKGVASLYGCRAASYRTAITWATVTTFAGWIASIFLAQGLLKKFSRKGLVPATLLGFPISTTHGITGAIVGCGLVAVGSGVNFGALGKGFVLPLLLSPILAIVLGGLLYIIFRG